MGLPVFGGGTASFRGTLLVLSTAQTTSSGVITPISWTSAAYDTGPYFRSGAASVITVCGAVTRIRLAAQFYMSGHTGAGDRAVIFYKNSALTPGYLGNVQVGATANQARLIQATSPVISCVSGDTFMVAAWQNAGGNISMYIDATYALNWFHLEVIE